MPKREELKKTLSAAAAEGLLSHAVLIEGENGLGKTELALWLARVLLCKSKNPPCGHCSACKKILTDNHPDVEIIGGNGKARGFHIDKIREIKDSLWLAPNESEVKIYILTEIEDMTAEAQNALLKSIEEPPAFVHFIMTTENRFALLDTILSRCAVYTVEPPSEEECSEILQKSFPELSKEDAELFSAAFGGNFGAAENAIKNDKTEILKLAAKTPELLSKGREYDLAAEMNRLCSTKEKLLEYTEFLSRLAKSSAAKKAEGKNPVLPLGIRQAAEIAEICDGKRTVLLQPGYYPELLQSCLCMELSEIFGGNL